MLHLQKIEMESTMKFYIFARKIVKQRTQETQLMIFQDTAWKCWKQMHAFDHVC